MDVSSFDSLPNELLNVVSERLQPTDLGQLAVAAQRYRGLSPTLKQCGELPVQQFTNWLLDQAGALAVGEQLVYEIAPENRAIRINRESLDEYILLDGSDSKVEQLYPLSSLKELLSKYFEDLDILACNIGAVGYFWANRANCEPYVAEHMHRLGEDLLDHLGDARLEHWTTMLYKIKESLGDAVSSYSVPSWRENHRVGTKAEKRCRNMVKSMIDTWLEQEAAEPNITISDIEDGAQ